MLLKFGVNNMFCHELLIQFAVIDVIFEMHAGREAIITSGNDGAHMSGSLHYTSRKPESVTLRGMAGACDLRTKDIEEKVVGSIVIALKAALKGFDIVNEHDHIHIEYDPK